MYTPSRNLMNCPVAGFSHWDGFEVFKKLEPGIELDMKAEPDNPYDPSAVALYCGRTKIGYIPRGCNEAVSKLLFFGHAEVLEARVASVDPSANLEHRVQIVIRIKDAYEH
jgi:hypothetical protein